MFDDILVNKRKKDISFVHRCAKCSVEWMCKTVDVLCWNCGSPLVVVETKVEKG